MPIIRPIEVGSCMRVWAAFIKARLARISAGKGATRRVVMSTCSAQVLAGGRKPALGGVAHLEIVVHPLVVEGDQLGGDPDHVALGQLALVERMDLGDEIGCVAGVDVIAVQAHQREDFVGRTVEEYMVKRHVEMAVIVDPIGLHRHGRGDERREEKRRCAGIVLHGQPPSLGAIERRRGRDRLRSSLSSLSGLSPIPLAFRRQERDRREEHSLMPQS